MNCSGSPRVEYSEEDLEAIFKHVPRYTRQQQIGNSLYGVVYKAWDEETRQLVAIKITTVAQKIKIQQRVPSGGITDDPFREAETMRHIQKNFGCHPHILQLVDEFVYRHASQSISRQAWDVNGDIHCLVTEFAAGGDLFDSVTKQPVPLAQAKHILKQIISALQFLHETCQIAHLDISLENIMITCPLTMTVKLADFGVAVPFYQIDPFQHIFIMSKISYRAPELRSGYGIVPSACDIFSLGVMTWMLLFQHAPFGMAGDRHYQLVQAQNFTYIFNRIFKISTPAEEVLDVFRQLLAHNPAFRPTIDQIPKLPFFQ